MTELNEIKKRRRRRKAQHPPQGTLPGTVVAVPESARPNIRLMQYDAERLVEIEINADLSALKDAPGKMPVTWVSVEGLGDADIIRTLGEMFGLHQLSLEDVFHLYQRPKMDLFEKYQFIVARVPNIVDGGVESSQICLMLGANFVVSFQERQEVAVEFIRDRIRQGRGRIRTMQADYLVYALLDTVIDGYFPMIQESIDRLESLEDRVLAGQGKNVLREVHSIRRNFLAMGKIAWPQRDVMHNLCREQNPLIREETKTYFRDVYDHTIQIIDFLDSYRQVCSDLMEVYLSSLNIRAQEVMKVLTIIATIFLPLSFIASLYGMNFDPNASFFNMPELRWRYGYVFALGLMAMTAIGFLFFFRKRGWLGTESVTDEDPNRKDSLSWPTNL